MELVKQFNSELSSLYETKPPISKAKMTSITRTAIKAIKLYKHVVQSVEKFIQKCKPEYKVPGLYVIDSIVRQSRHQFGTEKDVFAPRFARNLQQTFVHLFNCPPEDKSKVIRVLNLWQKNSVFESEVIQPLFDLADPNHPVHKEHKEAAALAPSNGITPVKPPATNTTPKNAPSKKEGGTAGWINQLNSETPAVQQKTHASSQAVDVNLIQQLQQLQTLLLDQQADNKTKTAESDQDEQGNFKSQRTIQKEKMIKFDKKLLDFDYGEEEDEDGPPHHQQQQQVVAGLDSLGSILANPEVLRQLQTLQQTLSNPQQLRQQQLEIEEKMRKMQEMRQQEEEFDKHLAQTVPNLPFADQCELKPGEVSGFPGMDMSQPPPGYPAQQKLLVPPGMMMKPPPSPLEDGEHASSDADERIGRRGPGEEGGPSVVVLDSDSPSDSPAHGRRRRRRSRSRSRSHHRRSRSDSRSRSRSKRKRRSSSFDDKDWEREKLREAEKEKERERKRKGLPPIKKNHLAVCSTTLWIGHLSKLVQQEELSDTFGEFGDIVSIDLIPPRGCAFICMNRRQDAHRALQDLRHHKLQGKAITLAWAPGKGMKGKEYKDYWEVEQGVSYIPWVRLTQDTDLELLEEGGMVDDESMPDWLQERQKKNKDDDYHRSQSSSQAEDDESKGELDIPVPAPTLPGYIPLPEGPQPADRPPVSQPPPTMPPLMGPAPPLGMMPPFGLPREYTGLLGPMGMAMGPGLMPNVPLGVPPPGMQGLMGNPLMHQQMMSRMPQPVGSPFNPPPGVGLLGPQLSQIPLPGQDKGKAGLTPLGVPPPNDGSAMPSFTDAMMQLPFTLPPQLQLQGMGMLTRAPVSDGKHGEGDDKRDAASPPTSVAGQMRSPFGQPPPQFSPMSLMKIPPPMSVPPPNKGDNLAGEDKDEREMKDKDYRDTPKDRDRDKERDRDRDYRNRRDRDYRGDRDYRDRFDKDYRERDKDYRGDKDRDRKDRRERSREREDKGEQDLREKDGKPDDKVKDEAKDEKGYRDRNDRDRSRNRERDRERDRGRDRKWGDRDRERGRDRERDDRRGRDRERERSKEMKGEREKGGPNIQDRLRNMAHEQDRGEFPRGGIDADNFQGPPGGPNFGPRNEGFHPEGYPPDMHGRHPGGRREGFDNRGPGPRDMFDHRGPPPDGFDPRGPPPEGFGPRGGPPMDNFGPRGPPPDGFGPRGPPPDGFGPRGPPPDGFDLRGPPPGGFGPDGFDPRGPPPEFDGQGPPPENFNMRGPPPDNFIRGPLIPDNFGPGGPPPDNFLRGPPTDEFGPLGPPFEGFGGPLGPPGEFQPRIRFELFSRGRGRGQESFRGRGARGGGPAMFSPRGAVGPRGPRAGPWMEAQGPSPPKPGFGFPPRGFAPTEGGPERFGAPVFEETGRGRGAQGIRGRGRGFQGRGEERRWEEEEATSPSTKRLSRWSNPSPPPSFAPPGEETRVEPDSAMETSATEPVAMDVSESQQDPVAVSDADKNPDNPFCPENSAVSQGDRSVGDVLLDINRGSEFSVENNQPPAEVTGDSSCNLPVEERNFPFGGISDDSSSMQMPTNMLATEREEASSVFQQDSQSIPDVEMSNSHYSFAESGQQSLPEDSQTSEGPERRRSFQLEDCQASEDPQRKEAEPEVCQLSEDPNRRFADIGFPERISHPEDNLSSSLQEDRQASIAEIEESFHSHTSQRLSNEMRQNIEFSMGDSVSSAVEQSVFEPHSETGPEYDPNESSQSVHFDQRPSDDFSENSQPCNQQTFNVEEPREDFSSFQEQQREDEPNFSEGSEPVHQPLPAESSFESHCSETSVPEVPAPELPTPGIQVQSCESGEVGGEIVSGETSPQEHNSSAEDSEQ